MTKLHFFAPHADTDQLDLLIQHFDLILSHKKEILDIPWLADIKVGRASGLYTASKNLTIKHLFYLWENEKNWMTEHHCPRTLCKGENLYLLSITGSPLSGSNACIGYCSKCKKRVGYKVPSFGKTALPAIKYADKNPPQSKTERSIEDLIKALK